MVTASELVRPITWVISNFIRSPNSREELLGSKRIGTVAVCDKPEAFGKVIAQFPESLPHGLYAGTDRPVHGSGIADDGAADGIHDEPDIGFDTADSDIGFISDEGAARACSRSDRQRA